MDLPPADPRRVSELLLSNRDQSSEPSIRLVLVPERLLELVPPERLVSKDFAQDIYVAGHDRSVAFFDSSVGKESHLAANSVLRITQRSQSGRHREEASLAPSEAGELTLVKDVRERDSGDPIQARHLLVEADLKASLERSFLCAAAVLDLVDPHDRCSSLWSGVAIQGATHRYLHSDTPLHSGIPSRMGDAGPTIAEKGSRRISRGVLRSPAGEIDRLMALFRRSLAPPKHS